MSKLVILAERNILSYLVGIGVKPYEFYTDVETFKKRAPLFEDVKLVIIFSGTCGFSKRYVVRMANSLKARVDNTEDTGLVSLTVLSDTYLPQCEEYYKYSGTPINFMLYSGWTLKSKDIIEFWKDFDYAPNEDTCSVYLRKPVTADEVRKQIESKTDYSEAIKIPKFDEDAIV